MQPIFIGGTGRSGTTVLKRVLARHGRVVALVDELRVIVDPGGALDLIEALSDRWSPYNADGALHRFRTLMREGGRATSRPLVLLEKAEKTIVRRLGMSPRRYLGLGLAASFDRRVYHRLLDQLFESLGVEVAYGSWAGSPPWQWRSRIYQVGPLRREMVQRHVAQLFHDLYRTLPGKPGARHWLDDTPANILHAQELLKLFPDMRLVHIYRDPRDVLASYHHFAWGGDSFAATARRLSGIYRRWFEIREALPEGSYLDVGLEKLSQDPKGGLTRICGFLGLEPEAALFNLPLDRVHAGRWRTDIPRSEWGPVLCSLAIALEMYGYPVE